MNARFRISTFASTVILAVWMVTSPALAQLEFERPPIDYLKRETRDPVAQLQQRIDRGEVKLEFDDRQGYLASVLQLLDIPVSSQALVFSKTSFQLRRIAPAHPRAIYFNDDNYIGWVQQGDVVEVASVDPEQGAIFYTLSLDPTEKPKFVRDRGQCLTCHASSRTQGVPGHLIRSVFAEASGQPLLGSGTFTTNHESPFSERWGGWYVTGTHGSMRHMGNVLASRHEPENLDRESGANVLELSDRFRTSPYLTPHSDIVALMVLEHQSQMHNALTFASYETRSALHYDQVMNEALDRPADHQSESTDRRIAAAGERILRHLLFTNEFQLESPVKGTSTFAEDFAAVGPRDPQGRSLRDFDLRTRMFKYPCSSLIYSASFDALPAPMKSYVTRRLGEILDGHDAKNPDFAHLTEADRQAIREILVATKPDLAACWQQQAAKSP
ncbi:MAG: hypothetical protein KDA71_09390 [Planctomycetales bacterium]|nr:hypothetical protein [Planctomycetales bacterium]